ncbi:MAG: hypothetical protein ABJD07_11650, partial [Gemmatimonadaceae bacterium]
CRSPRTERRRCTLVTDRERAHRPRAQLEPHVADAASRLLHNRVKGELERDVLALPYAGVTILRSSLSSATAPSSGWARRSPSDSPGAAPGAYKPMAASAVARVLVRAAADGSPGQRIIELADIRRLAGGRN